MRVRDVGVLNSARRLFDEASVAWDKGNSRRAFTLFLRAAEEGDPGAQLNVGNFFCAGESVRKDPRKALYWYKLAWKNGQMTGACSNIAQIYASMGNRRSALTWWRKAVNQGDGDAAIDLARFLILRNRRNAESVRSLLKIAKSSSRVSQSAVEDATALFAVLWPESR